MCEHCTVGVAGRCLEYWTRNLNMIVANGTSGAHVKGD